MSPFLGLKPHHLHSYMQAVPGLNTALSCFFDIRGQRVLVQALIPGLLCADQQSSLQYGRIESLGIDNWDKVPLLTFLSLSLASGCVPPPPRELTQHIRNSTMPSQPLAASCSSKKACAPSPTASRSPGRAVSRPSV
jgi:hypothetical protein